MELILTRFKDDLHEIEKEAESNPSWSGLMDRLEVLEDNLEFGWGLVSHLESVKNSEPLREEKQKMQPQVIEVSTLVSQSQGLYKGTKKLSEMASGGQVALDQAQARIVESSLRSFELGGVGLEGLCVRMAA